MSAADASGIGAAVAEVILRAATRSVSAGWGQGCFTAKVGVLTWVDAPGFRTVFWDNATWVNRVPTRLSESVSVSWYRDAANAQVQR